MTDWNATGYDMAVGDRWLYMFAPPDRSVVKVGLVLKQQRLVGRLREVRRAHGMELEQMAASVLPGVNHPEAEHIESTVRHWLCGVAGFKHSGLVDWLTVPVPSPDDWQGLLDWAVAVSISFGR